MIRLAVRVRRDAAEVALAELLELAPAGVEEVDLGADLVEYAVYGAPGELPELPDLRAAAGGALVEITTTEVADDWGEAWKRFHRPLLVGGRLYVRPPWEPASTEPGVLDIVIDPGQAFGTGAHPTTRLCLELLLELEPGGPLADLGTGSAVLAVAAAKLGYRPVVAVDHDPASVAAAIENAAANGVALEVARVDLRRDDVPAAPTVLANLIGPLLLELAPRLRPPLPDHLIVSGLLTTEETRVKAAFGAAGLALEGRRSAGEWAALRFAPVRPG